MTECPRCPNHAVPLELTDTIGLGICPISRCEFRYVPKMEKGKEKYVNKIRNGKIVREKDYEITGDENHDFQVS